MRNTVISARRCGARLLDYRKKPEFLIFKQGLETALEEWYDFEPADKEAIKKIEAILNETEQLRTAYETCQEHAQVCEETNRSYAEGLSRSIDEQFEQWSLSQAETEIARLLLKGLALKEIAAIRKVSERTARDQARAVYRKSSLANRNELAAFFLEDLLQPVDAAKENP